MPTRTFIVYIPGFVTNRVGIMIEMYQNGVMIGRNGVERDTMTEFVDYIHVLHYAYWEVCYEKFHLLVRDEEQNVIDEFDLDVSVSEGQWWEPTPWLYYGEHHRHENIPPPPPPPTAGPAPLPPPPTPITPPTGPPVEITIPVEIQPPDQPPVELPPYKPEKPPDHPPFKPPPKPTEPPPHVSPRETDRETFIRFMEKWGHQIDEFAVNVPLDAGLWVEQLDEPWRSLWAKLTEHKADLVFKRKGQLYVAEVKPRLSRGAIGEALVAAQMYELIYRPRLTPNPAVICQTASPILLQMAAHNGVLVFVTDFVDGSKLYGEVRIRRKMR